MNAAPFSFFNVLGTKPPIVGFSPGDKTADVPKDTPRNIRATGEFVVNLVDEATAEAMYLTSLELPYGESEIEHAGLTVADSVTIATPRIAEAPVALECVEWATLEIGEIRLVIGLVKRMIVRDGIIDPETLRVIRAATIRSDACRHPPGTVEPRRCSNCEAGLKTGSRIGVTVGCRDP